MGLSTAVNIQSLIPDADVTIIADKFGNETTSSGAGGLFRPSIAHIKGVPVDTIRLEVDSDHHSLLVELLINGTIESAEITHCHLGITSNKNRLISRFTSKT